MGSEGRGRPDWKLGTQAGDGLVSQPRGGVSIRADGSAKTSRDSVASSYTDGQ